MPATNLAIALPFEDPPNLNPFIYNRYIHSLLTQGD
jgi:hypothetical protein